MLLFGVKALAASRVTAFCGYFGYSSPWQGQRLRFHVSHLPATMAIGIKTFQPNWTFGVGTYPRKTRVCSIKSLFGKCFSAERPGPCVTASLGSKLLLKARGKFRKIKQFSLTNNNLLNLLNPLQFLQRALASMIWFDPENNALWSG